MFQPHATQTTEQVRRRRGMRPLTLLALGPIALGLVLGGCTAIEDTTDYIGDLFSHVEDDNEIFGEGAVPGGEEPYRSLSEVPNEAPAKSSAEERAALTAGLVADREKAQHTSEALRARVDPEEAMAQVRAVYVPADETVEPRTVQRRMIVPGVSHARAEGAPATAGVPGNPPRDTRAGIPAPS